MRSEVNLGARGRLEGQPEKVRGEESGEKRGEEGGAGGWEEMKQGHGTGEKRRRRERVGERPGAKGERILGLR